MNTLVVQSLLHLAATLGRALVSIGLALIFALPLGLLFGRHKEWGRAFRPLTYVLYTVPKISLFPLALLLFGLNDKARIFIVALVLFFQFLIAIRDGVLDIPEASFKVLKGLGAGFTDRFRFLIFPAILPRLLTALRIGSAAALSVLFFTETSAVGEYGLGKMCIDAWTSLKYPEMALSVILTILAGFLLFGFFWRQEKKFLRYKKDF